MSLDRKDIRASLDADLHAALKEICDLDGVTTAEFIESLLAPIIRKRIHDTIELADRLRRVGISRNDLDNTPDQSLAARLAMVDPLKGRR